MREGKERAQVDFEAEIGDSETTAGNPGAV